MSCHSLPFDAQTIAVSPDYFFNPKFFLAWLSHFFFKKCSNNVFTIEINNNTFPWYLIFHFSDPKHYLRPVRIVDLCKNIFIQWYSYMIINFQFRAFIIMLNIIFNIYTWVDMGRIDFDCFMLLYLWTI